MKRYLELSEIKTLQVEPTSLCNLLCPQCERVDKGKVNPLLPLTDLTPEDYDNIFTDELTCLKCVIFNGSYGDPVATRHLNYAIERIFSKEIDAIKIFTNGSLKKASYWRELGRRFAGTQSEVVFSIDGLEDTNSVYRVNSNFQKIMENASAYIQAGGRARWDFLVFQHNYHQVEAAKALAKKMGFKKFQKKITRRFVQGNYINHMDSDKIFNKQSKPVSVLKPPPGNEKEFEWIVEKYNSWDKYIDMTPIHCKYRHNMKALFVDFEAFVWPCCWVGAPVYRTNLENPQKKQFDALRNRYGKKFNSLRHHSFSKILSHRWFNSDLVQSWENRTTDQNPKLFTCGRTCGADYEFTSGPGYKNSEMFVL